MQKQTLSFLALVFILRGRNLFADEEAIETNFMSPVRGRDLVPPEPIR